MDILSDRLAAVARHLSLSANIAAPEAGGLAPSGTNEALLAAWLHEVEEEEIADFVATSAADFSALALIAQRLLPPTHPNRLYLERFAA